MRFLCSQFGSSDGVRGFSKGHVNPLEGNLLKTIVSKLSGRFYDSSKIDTEHLLFTNKALKSLLIPLIIEQLLASFMGMADTMMVARVGSAAISAVSLTDAINLLIIQILTALAAGGTILCSQYLGKGDTEKSNEAARQLLLTIVVISLAVTIVCVVFCSPLLHFIFGAVEKDVMEMSITYFLITSVSFPFLALSQAAGSFYRAGGNSRFPMLINVIANILNIVGNAIFLFVLGMGVAGAALATLLSRVFCGIVLMYYLRKPMQPIVIRNYLIRPDWSMISRALYIGIPSGIENGMFQFGKLAIQSSVSLLGTTAIAANAMVTILENVNGVGGVGIGIGMMTVVGTAMGAGRREETRYYVVKLTAWAWVAVLLCCLFAFAIAWPVTVVSGMEPESAKMTMSMITFVTITKPLVWVFSFIPSYGYRAAGDVRFSMNVSMLTMWLCRVLITTVLIRVLGFGPIAVWIGMACDWTLRAFIFIHRYFTGKWMNYSLIH